MLFDKLSLYFESYDNNQKMILEDKNIMTKEGLIEQLSDMVDILFEKKNFLIYIYILQKYFKKDDIYYKSITDYYFTDYNYVENLITNNGFNNLLKQMINKNELFLEVVELIKTLCDNYFLKNIDLIANGNYKVYKGVIDDKFNMIDNTLDNFDDLSGEQKKKYNTIINEKIGILKSYEVFDDEDDINNTQDEIDEIIYYFYNTYILPSENNTLKKEYNENFINDI